MIKSINVPAESVDNMIFISSPFGGDPRNKKFAEAACNKMIKDGYNPWAPHVYYAQFLDDSDPEQRELGIKYGLAILPLCKEMWMFVHDGISPGMAREEAAANELGTPIKRVDWSTIILPLKKKS